MASGTYCDVIAGDVTETGCTGSTVTVDGSGYAHIYIDNDSSDPVVAIHAGSIIILHLLPLPPSTTLLDFVLLICPLTGTLG